VNGWCWGEGEYGWRRGNREGLCGCGCSSLLGDWSNVTVVRSGVIVSIYKPKSDNCTVRKLRGYKSQNAVTTLYTGYVTCDEHADTLYKRVGTSRGELYLYQNAVSTLLVPTALSPCPLLFHRRKYGHIEIKLFGI
jgi:hypothetical protein